MPALRDHVNLDTYHDLDNLHVTGIDDAVGSIMFL